jgi:hypothetical protein
VRGLSIVLKFITIEPGADHPHDDSSHNKGKPKCLEVGVPEEHSAEPPDGQRDHETQKSQTTPRNRHFLCPPVIEIPICMLRHSNASLVLWRPSLTFWIAI